MTVMEVSKLSISPETLRFQKMSKGKRAKLRRQNIIDLIKSKPFGTPISLEEFAAAIQVKSTGTAYSMLSTMIKQGIVSKDKIDGRHITYSVNGPVTTRALSFSPERLDQPKPLQAIDPNSFSAAVLTQLAKEFYWEKTSNNLHDFVQWLKERK